MPDDKTKRAPLDNKRIDVDDPAEVRNWCKSFGCSAAELKKAVSEVGTSAAAVKQHLGK
ncbi:DUF3606 domain-containing protein [Desulfovibrio sp.]